MNFFLRFRMLTLFAAFLTVSAVKMDAQGFGLSVTASSASVTVSNTVNYTINVTNLTDVTLQYIFVTNIISSNMRVDVGSPTGSSLFTFSTNADDTGVVFIFGPSAFTNGSAVQIVLPLTPTTTGLMTNTVSASDGAANTTSTSVVTQVTNSTPILANVAASITGPSQVVITNDWMTYGITLTNFGSSDVTGVILTNTLPAGVIFKSVAPDHSHQTVAGTNLVFSLGTLPAGAVTNLQVTVEPTNAGVLTISATVGDNFVSTNIPVTSYLPGALMVVTNSAQVLNYGNLLEEQYVLLSNIGTNDVPSVRVVVSGLTGFNKELFNAFGTNNGDPFVVYAATLKTNGNVNLLLQYAPRPSFPFTNGQLHAFAVSPPNLTPPTVLSTSTNISFKSIQLTNGIPVIGFSTVPGRTYTVIYSDNSSFSNAMIAPPSIVAPANETFWSDYGPPETVASTNSSTRFYRVFQNP